MTGSAHARRLKDEEAAGVPEWFPSKAANLKRYPGDLVSTVAAVTALEAYCTVTETASEVCAHSLAYVRLPYTAVSTQGRMTVA